ncbi:MAG: bifunctional N(6)-L-threonylcarbamoyladenine synthase/serine/threonine protein kinase [Candidatus Nanohaloarchaeota archaeon QJJ-5]|nr:bifunctional N(6)-L-threonylcarbamoyladenine synthase/serine/threonine protein kinase [Candidatus Nanohaloarchaeota archaeon QJJ-5]
MITLGIESTAHTFGIGIIEDGTIQANSKDQYTPEEGGIHPSEASEHHYRKADTVLDQALAQTDHDIEDIDCIAFSRGPGLPQCLQIGGTVARSLAAQHDIPIVGVNHCVAHIEIGKLTTDATDPVTLYVSGGNAQIIAYSGGRYRVFGETLDIAIGNALDKFARALDIPHPGGPEIEQRARQGETLIDLPYVVKGMDFSFSGLVTEAQSKIDDVDTDDLCFSFQEYAFAMLIEAAERAMAHTGKDELLVTGGVAANNRLQEMAATMAEERDGQRFKVPHAYCMDNGAMIAQAGARQYRAAGGEELSALGTDPNWRTDQTEVPWIDD